MNDNNKEDGRLDDEQLEQVVGGAGKLIPDVTKLRCEKCGGMNIYKGGRAVLFSENPILVGISGANSTCSSCGARGIFYIV